MEIIKRTINLEQSTDRDYSSTSWSVMTASTFYLNVLLTQSIDDMGLFTDIETIPKTNVSSPPNYTLLINKLNSLGFYFPFMSGAIPNPITEFNTNETENNTLRYLESNESDYYVFGNQIITGATDSKIEDVRSYKQSNPFRVGFNVSTETYINYNDISVNGVNRIKIMADPKIYVFDTPNDGVLGTNNQIYGIQYSDYTGLTRNQLISGDTNPLPLTKFRYIGEGWNKTNTSLSALTKEEFLFGIISRPEVENDVFIDRGITPVLDLHLRLSEIRNLGQLTNYGNGLYKINKQ